MISRSLLGGCRDTLTAAGAGLRLVGALPFLASCAAAFLQTDGFRDKLSTGCDTEDDCRALVSEARARIQTCRPNTVGYIKCDDARADLEVAEGYVERFERRKVEDAELRERAAAAREAAQDQAREDALDAQQRAKEEEARQAESRDAEVRAETAWRETQLMMNSCASEGDEAACSQLQQFLSDFPDSPHKEEVNAAYETGLPKRLARQKAEADKEARQEATREAAAQDARRSSERDKALAIALVCGEAPPAREPSSGAYAGVVRHLRSIAHDPESIEVVGCSEATLTKSRCWRTVCRWRGRNVLGALVLSEDTLYMGSNGLIEVGK